MLLRSFCVFLIAAIESCYGKQIYRRSSNSRWLEVKVMTWNILAPMWIHQNALLEQGKVDTNLLNPKIRLWRIAQEIRRKKPDIVALQEVQEDIFKELVKELEKDFETTGLAPNENHYWETFLADGVTYQANGVATFYNRHKFDVADSYSFSTAESGSVAQVSVLRPKIRRNHESSPIIAVNCHLETGFTAANVTTRMAQGNRVVEEAGIVAEAYRNEDPTVFIIGDLNSMDPYGGFTNIVRQGYTDAQTRVGDSTACTYFFEPPFVTPGGEIVNGGAIDHVFLRTADVTEERAKLKSVEIPSVSSSEFSEESYIKDITKLLKMRFRDEAIKGARNMIPRLLKSDIFSSMYNAVHEEQKKEYKINRALRRGSDHLHVIATIHLKERRRR